jgi:hypothetical protein
MSEGIGKTYSKKGTVDHTFLKRVDYNGWDPKDAVAGTSFFHDYNRILFYKLVPDSSSRSGFRAVYEYATRKVYDVGFPAFFNTCGFWISFDENRDFDDAERLFMRLPSKYIKLIDEFDYKIGKIYFIKRKDQEKMKLGVRYIGRGFWVNLEEYDAVNNIKFIDDLKETKYNIKM